jgi:hypothetical protein
MLRKHALNIGDRAAIGQLGSDPPGLATPAGQFGHGVINTVFRPADDHSAAAVAHDINGDLPAHTGAASDDDDLLGIEVHGETLLLIILEDSCWAISPLPGKKSCTGVSLLPGGVSRHHPSVVSPG